MIKLYNISIILLSSIAIFIPASAASDKNTLSECSAPIDSSVANSATGGSSVLAQQPVTRSMLLDWIAIPNDRLGDVIGSTIRDVSEKNEHQLSSGHILVRRNGSSEASKCGTIVSDEYNRTVFIANSRVDIMNNNEIQVRVNHQSSILKAGNLLWSAPAEYNRRYRVIGAIPDNVDFANIVSTLWGEIFVLRDGALLVDSSRGADNLCKFMHIRGFNNLIGCKVR